MHGVVSTLISWYVPTVLYCNETFVKATKPQNANDNGSILFKGKDLALNTSNCRHIFNPIEAIVKCIHVKFILGNLGCVNNALFNITIHIDENKFANIETPTLRLDVFFLSVFDCIVADLNLQYMTKLFWVSMLI